MGCKHPVFKELYVVDGEEDWDYKASYNPEVVVDGPDKEENVIGQTPKVGLYKNLSGGSYVDPDSGRKIQLIGHHVAEYKLAEILGSFYSTVSSRVDEMEGLKEFSDKAKGRAEMVNGYAKNHGPNLSVVLLL